MTNKNGFTLIELIATIGLMVLMGIVITNNLSSLFSQQEDDEIESFQEVLESAACTYIDLSDPQIKQKKATCKTNGCSVTASILITNGLLDEDLINPLTGKKITGSEVIQIAYPNKEKTCTYHVG
ncbi:MAG: type II secretion system protein [Bacilli bacterium]|nr:type II secretion system protein [Bacilli bacterium]